MYDIYIIQAIRLVCNINKTNAFEINIIFQDPSPEKCSNSATETI